MVPYHLPSMRSDAHHLKPGTLVRFAVGLEAAQVCVPTWPRRLRLMERSSLITTAQNPQASCVEMQGARGGRGRAGWWFPQW